MNRGLAVTMAYKLLEDPSKLTEENLKRAQVLGWCVEMVRLIITKYSIININYYYCQCYNIFIPLLITHLPQFQSYFLVLDDIINGSQTRRGKECWYLKNNRGMRAIGDALLLEAGIYNLLRRYISDQPYYVDVLELIHAVCCYRLFIYIL